MPPKPANKKNPFVGPTVKKTPDPPPPRQQPARRTPAPPLPGSIEPGFLYIHSTDPPVPLTVRLGDGPILITAGYGGWTVNARPRRTSTVDYAGRDPFALEVPILFDGWQENRSVEPDISILNRYAIGDPARDLPPSVVRLVGPIPSEARGKRWVVNGIGWGNAIWGPGGRVRLRQFATVNFVEFLDSDQIVRTKPPRPRPKVEKYRIKPGDTLGKIAARKLGKASRYREIMKLNPKIKDPKKPGKPGTEILIPVK